MEIFPEMKESRTNIRAQNGLRAHGAILGDDAEVVLEVARILQLLVRHLVVQQNHVHVTPATWTNYI